MSKQLFLAVYEHPPGYVEGETAIGLFEENNKELAKSAAIKAMGVWSDDAERYIKIIPLGRMVTIAHKSTAYNG